MNTKLGKPTDQKLAMVSNLASDLLWYGHIETTFDRAKFEKKYPVLAQQFITKSIVAGSTRWTRKK